MKLLIIKTLTLKNFRIFNGTHRFDFSKSNIIVIDGPNGHGKSTIFDAISWVLTGKITRYIGSSEHKQFNYIVNNTVKQIGQDGASVEIELTESEKILKIKREVKKDGSSKVYINQKEFGV